jgi:hypothetical protein
MMKRSDNWKGRIGQPVAHRQREAGAEWIRHGNTMPQGQGD